MSIDKKPTTIQESAEQAEQEETTALAEENIGIYTHEFKKPFTYEGRTYERLSFDWESLSGKDSVAIERELLSRGIAVVNAGFTPEYLAAMAARACTYRNADGFRTISTKTLYALPLREFRKICGAAQRFLIRSESRPATGAAGSGNNA